MISVFCLFLLPRARALPRVACTCVGGGCFVHGVPAAFLSGCECFFGPFSQNFTVTCSYLKLASPRWL